MGWTLFFQIVMLLFVLTFCAGILISAHDEHKYGG